jgi:hypothetical protein
MVGGADNLGCEAVVALDFLAATHTSFFPTLLHVCTCFLTVRTAPGFLHGALVTCALGAFCMSWGEGLLVSDTEGTTERTTDAPAVAI